MITEGANGRIFEVTPEYEITWEYISPYFSDNMATNLIYRAYRVPYEWIPQLERPEEKAVPRLDSSQFRVPGNQEKDPRNVSVFEGGDEFIQPAQLCVIPTVDD
jgi:hypothetical protein